MHVESKQLTNKQIPQRIHTSNSVVAIMTAKGFILTQGWQAVFSLELYVHPVLFFI